MGITILSFNLNFAFPKIKNKAYRFSSSNNKDLVLDRIYRINKIKATLFHPDYPVNPVKN